MHFIIIKLAQVTILIFICLRASGTCFFYLTFHLKLFFPFININLDFIVGKKCIFKSIIIINMAHYKEKLIYLLKKGRPLYKLLLFKGICF